jgi:hypothetical protein
MALIPLLLAAFTSAAVAQGTSTEGTAKSTTAKKTTMKSPEEMAKEAVAKWKTTLKLTDDQTPQFESIMTDSYTKMAAAHTEAAGDKAKMKASMDQLMKDRADALSKVLTPDQMKTYEAQVTKNMHAAKSHMKSASTSK